MEITTSADARARGLLERVRETPMRRGALARRACHIRSGIARAIAAEGVPAALAQRIAFQLAFKFQPRDLFGEEVWTAIGRILQCEVACLRERVGMSDQRIVTTLPKLAASQVVELLDELTSADRRIARTILHAAVNTSDPLAAGRRYLAEYSLVARRLRPLDPTMARTVAAATFSAGMPLSKAMEHLERFSALMAKYQDNPDTARRLARAEFRMR